MPDPEKACQCSCAIGRTGEDAYQDVEEVAFLTRPASSAISPARPKADKTASLPRDAPFPMRHFRCVQRLTVPKRTPRFFACCGLAERSF